MSNAEEERRLAAIMVADAVGYSRLVEADERHTLAALRSLRAEIIDPAVARHHGRIVKPLGDGILAEFASVVAAVHAAIDIQRGTTAEQADILPARRLVFRIGINLGDVVVEDGDLFGHGVNVAARLEQICQPGQVYVSGSARDQLDGKLEFGLDWVGKHQVKNITRPIRVYSVRLHGPAKQLHSAGARFRRWLPWATAAAASLVLVSAGALWFWPVPQAVAGPSMIVLPFENLSSDKEQGYLADGISDDLTTELARVPGLFVLSRTAAFTYKGTETNPQKIAHELGVRYVLDGSVRRIGDDIRINAQLVDGQTGGHLWAERYDGAWADVLILQDKVVSEVATALELRLKAPAGGVAPGGTTNVAAYDGFLRGVELELRGSPRDFAEALRHFIRAIELDPEYGQAMAELAWVYYISAGNEERQRALGTGTLETIGLAQRSFERAMKHPSARGYQLAAERHINHWEPEMAAADLERAVALDPSNVWNYRQLAKAKILGGDPATGLTFIEASMRVDPREHQGTTSLRGLAQFALDQYADAAATLENSLEGPSSNAYDNLLPLMATYGKLGAVEKAKALAKDLDAYAVAYGDGGMTGLLAAQYVPFARFDDVLRFQDGLARAGIPELPFGLDPGSSDRLSADEMHALTYGHTLAGQVLELGRGVETMLSHDFKVGVPWRVATSADGSNVSYIWGGVSNSGGHIHHEGDRDCFYFAFEKACAVVFRNPSGTPEQQNEYYWFHHWYRIAFSVER